MLFIQRIHNKNKNIEKNKIIWIRNLGLRLIKNIEVSINDNSYMIYNNQPTLFLSEDYQLLSIYN
jgi:hypothetical protein